MRTVSLPSAAGVRATRNYTGKEHGRSARNQEEAIDCTRVCSLCKLFEHDVRLADGANCISLTKQRDLPSLERNSPERIMPDFHTLQRRPSWHARSSECERHGMSAAAPCLDVWTHFQSQAQHQSASAILHCCCYHLGVELNHRRHFTNIQSFECVADSAVRKKHSGPLEAPHSKQHAADGHSK